MANLIDKSYFVADRNIPNTNTPAVEQRLNWFIAKYESELLRLLLGYETYKDLVAGLVADPVPSKWTELKNGKEYTVNDTLFKWDGLLNATTKESIIADYVYYWWMRDQATQTSGVGEVATKTENAVRVSPMDKMCAAWNEMVVKAENLQHFLENNTTTYDTWTDVNYWTIRPINTFNL